MLLKILGLEIKRLCPKTHLNVKKTREKNKLLHFKGKIVRCFSSLLCLLFFVNYLPGHTSSKLQINNKDINPVKDVVCRILANMLLP